MQGSAYRSRKRKLVLTPEQFQQICNSLGEPYRTMVTIALCLGVGDE